MNQGAVVDPSHRQEGIATDMANAMFQGARNPDDLLHVRFYIKSIQDNFQTEKQGRPIFIDETWIEIKVPGNNLSKIERPKYREDEFRFPRHWAYFQQTHGKDGVSIGTPLSQWSLLRPAQVEELKGLQFYTVEQVAQASDEQLRIMGMGPGMAPAAFRERARLYLENAKDTALAVRQAEEIKKRDEAIADLTQKVNALMAAQKPAETLHVPEKKR